MRHPPATLSAPVAAIPIVVLFLMLAEVMRLWTLHDAFPSSRLWALVAFNTTHVPWQGCSMHDLIQPAFSFLVGASLPFSIASRKATGQSFARMVGHAAWRSVLLILLGIFLRAAHGSRAHLAADEHFDLELFPMLRALGRREPVVGKASAATLQPFLQS